MAERDMVQTRRKSSRNKRDEILSVAIDTFGRDGFEESKWADVAAAVGVGSTALYHYFESKQHCLYVVMAEAIEIARADFDRITGENDFATGVRKVLEKGFELDEHEVQRSRVLVAGQTRISGRRKSPREEQARQAARVRGHDLEVAWATFLARGMEQKLIPEANPQLLSRTVIGLHSSVWLWYRPGGMLSLEQVAEFYVPRHLAMIGLADGA
ncbi:MAG: TetR/AcrR family transcriptional regulator [Thermoleophilia bacterium]|nr:TetR/AcrR family transcriptional regulator [Thermoleophilia bacterium]